MEKEKNELFPFGIFNETMTGFQAEDIEFEPVEGTPDIPPQQEVDDEKIMEEKEEFADYMKKKYATPGI